MYMYFTKIISRNLIIVEGYEDKVLNRGFNFFFHSSFSKTMLSILFTWKKLNLMLFLIGKTITTLCICGAGLIRITKETLILMFFTEVSQIK